MLNVSALTSPPLTGVGQYVRHLLDGLLDPASGIEPICIVGASVVPPPPPPVDGETPQAAPPLPAYKRALMRVPGLVPARNAVRAAQFRRRVARLSCDIYHEPNHIVLAPPGARVVLTIHDLSVLHYPAFHPAERVRTMGRHLAASAHRADRIITPSAYIARDVARTMGVDPAKLRAVHHGVGPEFRPMTEAELAPVLDQHGLHAGQYLLALGTREPRKNLDRLLEAFMALPETVRAGRPLVLVGAAGWLADTLEQRIDRLVSQGTVRRLGYVPDRHRPALYAGSAGFAYPSIYEGFGMPPLEAAAAGAPVLTSIDSPMAEVLGEAALLIDPLDTGAIATGLERMLTGPPLARAARDGAAGWAARFTWAAAVARTADVYRELA